jgi:hypothetical protein
VYNKSCFLDSSLEPIRETLFFRLLGFETQEVQELIGFLTSPKVSKSIKVNYVKSTKSVLVVLASRISFKENI